MKTNARSRLDSASNALTRASNLVYEGSENLRVKPHYKVAAEAEIHLALLLIKEVLGEDNA